MSRFQRGKSFLNSTLLFLKTNRDLVKLPLLVLLILGVILTLEAGFCFYYYEHHSRMSSIIEFIIAYILFAFLANLISLYINSVLYICVLRRLQGKECSISMAWHSMGKLHYRVIEWALLKFFVDVIFHVLHNLGKFGEVTSDVLNISWSVVSYFVMPIMIIKDIGPFQALKQSAILLKNKWRRNFQLINVYVILLGVFLFIGFLLAHFMRSSSLQAVEFFASLFFIWMLLMYVIRDLLNSIVASALYIYSAEKQTPHGFDKNQLDAAFLDRPLDKVIKK